MAVFEVGLLESQGRQFVAIAVQRGVAAMDASKMEAIRLRIEHCAKFGGLDGTAILVWQTETGTYETFCPPDVLPLLAEIGVQNLVNCISSELVCLD